MTLTVDVSEVPSVAVIVTLVDCVTECAAAVNPALAVPAWITTEAGTDRTAGLLLASVTVRPPAGAL